MRTKVVKVRESDGDWRPTRKNQRQHVGREAAFCRSCINLLYLDGIVRCAEYKFLLSPQDIQSSIDCPKYLPLSAVKTFKIFTGVANKMHVLEELAYEAVIRITAVQRRGSTILEVAGFLTTNKKTAFRVLERLRQRRLVTVSTAVLPTTNPKKKFFKMNVYFPKLLKGKMNETQDG